MNALGQAIAQQQFNALVDVMSYEELYEFFGGGASASSLLFLYASARFIVASSPDLEQPFGWGE